MFATPGTFVVALRVTADLGGQAVTSLDVTIVPPVPAVSQWGITVLVLLLLVAGTVLLANKRLQLPATTDSN